MAAAATVTYRPSIAPDYVEGKYVCDATPALTYINVGFVPTRVEVINVTDKDTLTIWTKDMADGTAMTITAAAAAVASGAITPVPQTDGTNHGFSVGTDVSVQEASKTWSFRAWR